MRYFPRYSYRKITLLEHNGRRWGECVHSELVTQGATIFNFNLRLSPFVCIQTRVQLSSKPQNAPANKSTTIFFATKRKLRCVCFDLYLLKKTQYLWPFILLMVTKPDDIPRGSLVRCSCVWIKRTSPSGLVNFSGEFRVIFFHCCLRCIMAVVERMFCTSTQHDGNLSQTRGLGQ